MDKLIRVNSLKEIAQAKILTSAMTFHPDGLLSNDIFGYSIKDRQTTFAYIDLHGWYIHPLIYHEVFKKSIKILISVVNGSETVSIKDGKVILDPNGWTGVDNLYKHWNEITIYGATDKSIGNKILPMLDRKDIFINKFIVIPPFYHDADVNTATRKVKVSELTSMYSKLISAVQFKTTTKTSFDIVSSASTQKIQDQIQEIYLFLSQAIAKKTGYIRKRLLSKKVDYGIRSVLTAPSFTGKEIDLDTYQYDRLYIPMNLLNSGAYPFIIKHVTDYFNAIETNVTFKSPEGEWAIWEPTTQFDFDYCETLIENYNKFSHDRFTPIKMTIENIATGEKKEVEMLEEKTYADGTTKLTPVTITDICYRAAYDSCFDRYAQFTRYPVLNVYGIFFAKIDVLSTLETEEVTVNGITYSKYPKIQIGMSHELINSQFYNTVKFSISRLGGLVGDFDGDTGPIKILYSDEANAEAKKIAESKMDKIDILGTLSKTIGNEAAQGCICLTRRV